MKKILILLVASLFISGCKSKINTYDTKMICKQIFSEEVDEEVIESQSIIYVDYNDKNYVTKAIYQSISDNSNYDGYVQESLNYLINIYNEMEGISARKYTVDNKFIFEIIYDYDKIDLEDFRSKLGNLIDTTSVLGKATKLPVNLSEYQEYELEGYKCEVK